MKVAVIGAGAVGAATALSLIERNGMCREIVLLDRKTERANGVAIDMRYATPLSPMVDVPAGGYDALTDAALVIITAGVNELSSYQNLSLGLGMHEWSSRQAHRYARCLGTLEELRWIIMWSRMTAGEG